VRSMWQVSIYQFHRITRSPWITRITNFLTWIFSWSPWRIDYCCGHDTSWSHHHENIEMDKNDYFS
jgi:hypothetical protein